MCLHAARQPSQTWQQLQGGHTCRCCLQVLAGYAQGEEEDGKQGEEEEA